MPFRGVVIEESLADSSLLRELTILRSHVLPVTDWHQTPWLAQWTMHVVEIADADAEAMADGLSTALDAAHAASWYVDFKDDTTHYVIFPRRVFRLARADPSGYDAAKAYGRELGIPDHQLDFDTVDLATP